MPLNWTALTPEQLAMEASLHADDHNDGSMAFFDPNLATWSLVSIHPETLNVFKSIDEAASWIKDEINFLKADGVMGRAKSYEDMITNGIQDPVIVGKRLNDLALWDGFHRVAIAMIRKEPVLTILGEYHQ